MVFGNYLPVHIQLYHIRQTSLLIQLRPVPFHWRVCLGKVAVGKCTVMIIDIKQVVGIKIIGDKYVSIHPG
jgi:hypothetical protein